MRKIFLLLFFSQFVWQRNYAQVNPATTLTAKDSADILQALAALLDSSDHPTSYMFANVGIGNRLFSTRNNSLNAKQSSSHTIIYSPSIGYFHKSGFSVIGCASLLNDGKKFGVTQYSVNPAFDLVGNKNFAVGISYTYYLVADKYSAYASPIQHDFFGSFTYKKPWIEPGIAVGYSLGEYNEALYRDTVVNGNIRHRYDSMTNKLNAFSMTLSASHEFLWYGVLNDKDAISFTPSILLNTGSSTTVTTHKTNAPLINHLLKKGKLPKLQSSKYEVQSMGVNLDLNYTIGNFTFEPQVYLDYYFPKTDAHSFSQVFTINVGYAF